MANPDEMSQYLRKYKRVTRLPEILNAKELHESVRANRPPLDPGQSVSVLVSLDLDAAGSIERSRALPNRTVAGERFVAVLRDRDGRTKQIMKDPHSEDPEVMRAAERAVSILRFRPAERHGEPVAFEDLRMTIGF